MVFVMLVVMSSIFANGDLNKGREDDMKKGKGERRVKKRSMM